MYEREFTVAHATQFQYKNMCVQPISIQGIQCDQLTSVRDSFGVTSVDISFNFSIFLWCLCVCIVCYISIKKYAGEYKNQVFVLMDFFGPFFIASFPFVHRQLSTSHTSLIFEKVCVLCYPPIKRPTRLPFEWNFYEKESQNSSNRSIDFLFLRV